jgi:hypothetical protein
MALAGIKSLDIGGILHHFRLLSALIHATHAMTSYHSQIACNPSGYTLSQQESTHWSSGEYYTAPIPSWWIPLPRPDRYLGKPSFNPIRFTVGGYLGVPLIDIYEGTALLDWADWQLFTQSGWRTTKLQLYVRPSVLALFRILTPFS